MSEKNVPETSSTTLQQPTAPVATSEAEETGEDLEFFDVNCDGCLKWECEKHKVKGFSSERKKDKIWSYKFQSFDISDKEKDKEENVEYKKQNSMEDLRKAVEEIKRISDAQEANLASSFLTKNNPSNVSLTTEALIAILPQLVSSHKNDNAENETNDIVHQGSASEDYDATVTAPSTNKNFSSPEERWVRARRITPAEQPTNYLLSPPTIPQESNSLTIESPTKEAQVSPEFKRVLIPLTENEKSQGTSTGIEPCVPQGPASSATTVTTPSPGKNMTDNLIPSPSTPQKSNTLTIPSETSLGIEPYVPQGSTSYASTVTVPTTDKNLSSPEGRWVRARRITPADSSTNNLLRSSSTPQESNSLTIPSSTTDISPPTDFLQTSNPKPPNSDLSHLVSTLTQKQEFFSKLLNQTKYTDVVLVNHKDEQVNGFRCFLAHSSPVLQAIFDSKDELPFRVEVGAFEKETMKQAVQFSQGDLITVNGNAMNLLKFAKKYAMQILMDCCFSSLAQTITTKNICEYIKFAYDEENAELKKRCLEFLKNNKLAIDPILIKQLPQEILFDAFLT